VGAVPDRLRDLLDLVAGSLDEPGADGAALARRANFSRDHLDRLLGAATGETAVALRRRLLLERAAWQLRAGGGSVSAVAVAAGYGSLAAFSRAFGRAYGVAPSVFAADGDRSIGLPAPNGVRFHPPAGLLLPDAVTVERGAAGARCDVSQRFIGHHLAGCRALLRRAAALPEEDLRRPLRPGLVIVGFEGEEACAGLMAERLVHTLEVWVAALDGEPYDGPPPGTGLERLERAGAAFARIARTIRDRDAWEAGFIDALCEPPESFRYGDVIAHVIERGAARRAALAEVLNELGAAARQS